MLQQKPIQHEEVKGHVQGRKASELFTIAVNKVQAEIETNKTVVNLKDVIDDVMEYHGITDLGWFLVYFIIANLVLFLHWDIKTPVMKSAVEQSFLSFGPDSWYKQAQQAVYPMSDAIAGVMGYTQSVLTESDSTRLPNDMVRIGEYARVMYIRYVANVARNCKFYPELFCSTITPTDRDSFNATGAWTLYGDVSTNPFSDNLVAEVYTYKSSRNDSISLANGLLLDMNYLAKFSFGLSVEILVQHLMDDTDWDYFDVQVVRSGSSSSSPSSSYRVASTTLSLRRSMHSTKQDYGRAGLEVLYVLLTLFYLLEEINQMYMSLLQYGSVVGLRKYWKSFNNKLDVISLLLSLGQSTWYITMVIRYHNMEVFNGTSASLDTLVHFGTEYSTFLYASTLNNLLIGVRVLKYMKLHGSLRIYAHLMGNLWRKLKDFLWFFLYIMLLLGAGTLAYFQISGGNPLFATVQNALSSIALLTFGFLDYLTFENNGLGLGTWQPTVILVFWISVMFLIVISQNIVLAIVAEAYEEAKEAEGDVEASVFKLLILRTEFEAQRLWSQARMQRLRDFVEEQVQHFEDLAQLRGEGFHTGDLYREFIFARWAVALVPESRALAQYWICAASTKVRRCSPWDPRFRQYKEVKNERIRRSFGHVMRLQVIPNKTRTSNSGARVAPMPQTSGKYSPDVASFRKARGMPFGGPIAEGFEGGDVEQGNGFKDAYPDGMPLPLLGMNGTRANGIPAPSGPSHTWATAAKSALDIGAASMANQPTVSSDLVQDWSPSMLHVLMGHVIPNNHLFCNARHLAWHLRLHRFNPDAMEDAASLIARVYATPVEQAEEREEGRKNRVVRSWMGKIRNRALSKIDDVMALVEEGFEKSDKRLDALETFLHVALAEQFYRYQGPGQGMQQQQQQPQQQRASATSLPGQSQRPSYNSVPAQQPQQQQAQRGSSTNITRASSSSIGSVQQQQQAGAHHGPAGLYAEDVEVGAASQQTLPQPVQLQASSTVKPKKSKKKSGGDANGTGFQAEGEPPLPSALQPAAGAPAAQQPLTRRSAAL